MATPLEQIGSSLCYPVVDTGFDAPEVRLGQAQRTRIRSLTKMQKEALVTSSRSGTTWRFGSDEGPYLDGADVAPPPLAFLTTGMVSSYLSELLGLAEERDVGLDDVELVLDNYYTISGSLLRGTMIGSALAPDLEARIDADADESALARLVEEATVRSPVHGLMSRPLDSRFALVHNGRELTPQSVDAIEGPTLPDPAGAFDGLVEDTDRTEETIIRRTGETTEPFPDADEKYTEKDAAGYSDEQDRMIHVRGTARRRDDGVTHVRQELFSPRGTIFEFLSEEPEGYGGEGRAPDAASYLAAGIGLCFMTQIGRYAGALDEDLGSYRLVQDTHLSTSPAYGGDDEVGSAEPVETHLYVDAPADESFVRTTLEMSEQTCYLHALCRTDGLNPGIDLVEL